MAPINDVLPQSRNVLNDAKTVDTRFPISHFGGYEISTVNSFIVGLEKDVASAQNEIQTLQKKIRILVHEILRLRNEKEPPALQPPSTDEIEYLKRLFDETPHN